MSRILLTICCGLLACSATDESLGQSTAPAVVYIGRPGLPPTRSVILGVRRDPLDAYPRLRSIHFPDGVPRAETGVALDLLRAGKAHELIGATVPLAVPSPDSIVPPSPVPADDYRVHKPLRLQITAVAVNTGRTLDPNELKVRLAALDAHDRHVPIHGTVRLSLRGRTQELVPAYGHVVVSDPGRELVLDRWTRTVRRNQASTELLLPLSSPVPAEESDVFPAAELTAHVAISGHGIVAARTPVLLKLRESAPESALKKSVSPRRIADELAQQP